MGDPADRRWAQSIARKVFKDGYVEGLGDRVWRNVGNGTDNMSKLYADRAAEVGMACPPTQNKNGATPNATETTFHPRSVGGRSAPKSIRSRS